MARGLCRRLRRRPQLRAPFARNRLRRPCGTRSAVLRPEHGLDLYPHAGALWRYRQAGAARVAILVRQSALPHGDGGAQRRRRIHYLDAARRARCADRRPRHCPHAVRCGGRGHSGGDHRARRVDRWCRAACRRIRWGAHLARRRRDPSVHADRRLRHEHRHRRCGQSCLEARGAGAGLGWAGAPRLLCERAQADRRAQHRRLAGAGKECRRCAGAA